MYIYVYIYINIKIHSSTSSYWGHSYCPCSSAWDDTFFFNGMILLTFKIVVSLTTENRHLLALICICLISSEVEFPLLFILNKLNTHFLAICHFWLIFFFQILRLSFFFLHVVILHLRFLMLFPQMHLSIHCPCLPETGWSSLPCQGWMSTLNIQSLLICGLSTVTKAGYDLSQNLPQLLPSPLLWLPASKLGAYLWQNLLTNVTAHQSHYFTKGSFECLN